MSEISDQGSSDDPSSLKMVINKSSAEAAVVSNGDQAFRKPDGAPRSSGDKSSSSMNGSSKSSSSSSSKPKDHQSSSSSSKDRDRHGSSSSHSKSSSSSSDHKHREGSSSSRSHGSSSSSSSKSHSSSSSVKGESSSSSKPRDSSSSSSTKHTSSSSSSSSKHKEESKNGTGSSSLSLSKPSGESKDRSKEGSSRPKEGSSGSSSSKPPKIQESSMFLEAIVQSNQRPDRERLSTKPSSSSNAGAESVKKENATPIRTSVGDDTTKVKSEVASVAVKKELSTPVKSRPPVSSDEDDIPLFNRIDTDKQTPVSKKMDSDDDDDDTPLFSRAQQIKTESQSEGRVKVKRKYTEDSGEDSDVPLAVRAGKAKKKSNDDARRHSTGVVKKRKHDDDDDDFSSKKMKTSKSASKVSESPTKGGKKKKDEGEETKWKWWEEEKRDEGVKWKTLEHNGPMFAPAYEPLPKDVRFFYDGKQVRLSHGAEEVAGFYAKMLEHDYTTRDVFNKNFLKDWRKVMTKEEKELIVDLKKCNFKEMFEHFKLKSEERKNMSKEEKNEIKKQNEEYVKKYGFCIIDGHKQKIGNFRIEPPGLFRGRGEHPKQGMLKTRTMPSDVMINCSKGSKIPEPPPGTKWKEVRHDNTVTWLCSWNENIQNSTKYVMLNAASKLKGEKDWMKYETARNLHRQINKIRRNYTEDLHSKEMAIRQRAVAMYFIDKLALRAGNEKDEDTADTVGCCSLRVEHISLQDELDGKQHVVVFDFPGKDSIRYYNAVPVDKQVFKSVRQFLKDKNDGDDLFDRLNTGLLNKHLQGLMDGLSAKVFRTYNASRTLQEQLDLLTNPEDSVAAKLLSYNRANRAVAILCNHQRAAPKNFDKQMENMQSKIDAKKDAIKAAAKEVKDAKSDYKATKSVSAKTAVDKKEKSLQRLKEQLAKLEVQATDKDENKEIALGTSKLNYLDPRISVAWCKKWEIPLEKVYNKTQREKFAWAIDMAEEDYSFI